MGRQENSQRVMKGQVQCRRWHGNNDDLGTYSSRFASLCAFNPLQFALGSVPSDRYIVGHLGILLHVISIGNPGDKNHSMK